MDLTERQWKRLEPLLPKPRVRKDHRGRPWRDPRDVLNRVLWVMRTGAPWQDSQVPLSAVLPALKYSACAGGLLIPVITATSSESKLIAASISPG